MNLADTVRKTRKKRFGDRKEGRRLRSLDPFYSLTPFIMKTRGDATNNFKSNVEITAAEKYIREKRNAGFKGFGMLHIFVAGYVRTVSQYPAINRFISGKRIYARNNVEIVMTIKKRMSSEAGETTFKVVFQPSDTVDDVYRRMSEEVDKIKTEVEDNHTEKVAGLLCSLPRPVLSGAIKFIGWLDYHGWCPMYLLSASPFHGSLVVSDLGSLGIDPVFHHLYNFGNVPIFVTFGVKRKATEFDRNGVPVERKYIDYTVVSDERICDGYYFAISFKYMNYILHNPQILDKPPENVIKDVD